MRKLSIYSVLAFLTIGFIYTADISAQQEEVPESVDNSQGELLLVGDIAARSMVMVFPRIPGKVEDLRVEVGDSVRKDDILAVVEHVELGLGVRQAEAALNAAQSGLKQAKAMSEVNVISQFEQTQAGLSAAKAILDQANALSQTQTSTQVAQAEAGLAAAKAILQKAKEGARKQEKKQVESLVEQAKANVNNIRNNYERVEKLYKEDAVSEQTYEALKTQLSVAEAQYESALQQLNLVNEGTREEDIEAAKAQLNQAEAVLQMAKKLDETRNWEKDIALAESKLKQAQALMKQATAAMEAKTWEDEIKRVEMTAEQAKVALELAQKRLSDATITAPISGIVSLRSAELGGMVAQTSPAFIIIDIDTVKAKVSITEADLYKIKLGDEAWVSVDALEKPIKGVVTVISPMLDMKTRTTTVEISIDNKDHKLKPGMFARAKIKLND
jgi:HlyD family secretion protein